MNIKQISIYQDFQCTGADCSANCCRGWKVPIDDKIYQKFIQEKGIFGTLLRCAIVKKEDIIAFRSRFGSCPFLGLDHLCTIQKRHGTEYMPLVCIQFPRQLYHLGFFCEETLYLACPEAARLFWVYAQEDRSFDFNELEGEPCYELNTTNDDKEFLNYLLQSRDELIQMLRQGCRYNNMAILNYGKNAQNACLNQSPLPSPLDFGGNTADYFTVDCLKMNQLFFNGFYHPHLKSLSPFLYQLCKKYIAELGLLSERDADAANRKLAKLKKHTYDMIPDLDKMLDHYYEYFLLTNFLDIFEDYSFSKHLLFGMAKTEMFWLFLALYGRHKKQLSIDEITRIMAVYERRAPQIEDALRFL